MKNTLRFTTVVLAALALCFSACNKEQTISDTKYTGLNLPATPYRYGTSDQFNAKATLGRVLFYDSRLSANSSISCGTCHKQTIAFSDDARFSLGFKNKLTSRNTLPIQNLDPSGCFSGGFTHLFWDGRETNLSDMVLMPMLNHVEMGMDDDAAIVKKVKDAPYYAQLFQDAFNDDSVTIENISSALAAFTRSITSNNTLFDKYLQKTAQLNAQQALGKDLFFTKYNCNSCHQTQQLNGYQFGGSFSNIGLDAEYADNGRGVVENNPQLNGMFKIPNLRNIALTAPYMHDGRFGTLEEVIEHYSHGVKSHPNLDFRLQDTQGTAAVLNITPKETEALIAFMETLTDYTLITDPKFSNPFTTSK